MAAVSSRVNDLLCATNSREANVNILAVTCRHGLHRPACFRSEPKQATPAQPRGDGFRPYKKDTEEDERLKGYLATLMLSRRIEDLMDLDGELVDSLYRKLAAKRHPDKDANEEAGRRFIELQTAREEVKKKLPFRMPFC